MYAIPRRRKVDGKFYAYHHSVAYKRSVELAKEELKNNGFKVRVFKAHRKGFGPRWYLYVYK
jgi:predicted deacetylase